MKRENWLKIVLSFASECRSKMILSVIFATISVAGGMVPYIGVYQIIILFFNGTQTLEGILFWAGISLAGYILKLLFYAFSTTLSHISAYKILENIRLKITEKLMKAPLGTVLNQTIGKMKSVIIDRVETIELPLAHLIPEGFSNLILPIAVFVYLLIIDWRMALISLVTVPIAGLVYGIMMRNFNRQYSDYMKSSNHVNSVIVEFVEGIEVIKAFNQSSSSYLKFQNAVNSFKLFTLAWFRSTWKLMNLGNSILPSTLLGTVPMGILFYINGTLAPADLIICIILSLGIVGPLTSFTVFVNDAKAIEYAIKDADEFLNIKELKNSSEKVVFNNHDIEIDNVSFKYDDKNQDSQKVLKGINLKMQEGTFSALVGPSGGGKSTLAKLIARFWDVTDGRIKIGGHDIRDIPLDQLADTVSFVTQDNFLFNCSLKENIKLGNPDATDSQIIEAAKAAQCHEFISKLPKGYETTAGEAGGKLSGGEKQRITIARAILKNTPVVVLDEATAFTDPENEDKIQKSLASLTKDKTLLVIAHRLSTIKNANQIIVLDRGNIIDKGTHKELLDHSKLYKGMWEAHIGAKNWSVSADEKGALKQNV